MAVPFYVPNDGGSSDPNSPTHPTNSSGGTSSSSNVGNQSISGGPIIDNNNLNAANRLQQQDPLLGALCEALYRVLLARQAQGSGFNLPPPPSPTCSPHQPNHQFSEVFFPSNTMLPLETINNQQNQPLNNLELINNHHQQLLTSTTAAAAAMDVQYQNQQQTNFENNYHSPLSSNSGQRVGSASATTRRTDVIFDSQEQHQQGENLRIFEGQVPASRRRRLCNTMTSEDELMVHDAKDERAKESLSWPVVTAVLVAVGCGILRATR